jgi:peptide/nickel transport system permease protein
MTAYIVRRLIQAVFVAILLSIIVFLTMRILPGDPIYLLISGNQINQYTEEEINRIRHEHGLDRPMFVQYIDWMAGVVRGDFGISLITQKPVTDDMWQRLPITLYLGMIAVIIATVLGILAGTICAIRRGTWMDTVVTILSNIGITVPVFWLGIVGIYTIGLELKWLPIHGFSWPNEGLVTHIKQLIMPIFCLSIFSIAANARQTRSSMLEVLHQDYIRTAWSKGLKERVIIIKHSLKNALIPVVTLIGMQVRFVVGGAVLVETIFNINGMGSLVVNAVLIRDYPVVQSTILLIGIVIILVNLAVDLSYGWLDPRIRYN